MAKKRKTKKRAKRDPLDVLDSLATAVPAGPWRVSPDKVLVLRTDGGPFIDPDDGIIVAEFVERCGQSADTEMAAYVAALSPEVVRGLTAEARALRAAKKYWKVWALTSAADSPPDVEALRSVLANLRGVLEG